MKKLPKFPCPLADAVRSAPDAIAICSGDQTWTYRAWDGRVRAATGLLASSGIGRGTRVAIISQNSTAYLTLLIALWRVGAVACPLNVRWPRERLKTVVNTLCSRSHDEAHVFFGEGIDPGGEFRARKMEEVIDYEYENENECEDDYDPRQHATIYFTSGSSGEPKAVLHRMENHYANAQASNDNIPYEPGDCWLLSLPLYHVAGIGILWRTLFARATLAIPAAGEEFETALARYNVTHVSLVTTQLHRLLHKGDPGEKLEKPSHNGAPPSRAGDTARLGVLRNLKAILLGGSPVPPPLVEHSIALALPLYKTYGLTEAASQVATTRPNDPPLALLTSGTPLLPNSVGIGDDGHIYIRGATRFEGYLVGDGIERPFDAEGWFDTGDRGEWTPEGYLRVIGRADNMFIAGGENVQPEEVERALATVPGIEEAIVVAVPDVEYGHCGVAFVRTSVPLDEPALRERLRARLPGYMIPRRFHPWPDHLLAADAKVNRRALEEYARTLDST